MVNESAELLQKLFSACEKKASEAEKILEQSSLPLSSWIPDLIRQLFAKETSQKALSLVRALVTINDAKYSLPISEAVRTVSQQKKHDLSISDDLMQVWMFQMCCTSQVSVHSNLLEAFQSATQLQGIVQLAMPYLVAIWKQQGNDNAIVSIRCSAVFLNAIKLVGDVALDLGKELGATHLLVQLIQNEEDPLSQLSALDLFPQVFPNSGDIPAATRDWMSQSNLTTAVVKMLEDPIVGGAAMQYLALVANLGPKILQTLCDYIRSVGPTTNELERLQIVHALSSLAQSSSDTLDFILQDGELRNAWWDISRMSIPKLKAAILSSIAQTLQHQQNTNAPSLLRLYTLVGQDHSHESTTAWILQKFANSPMEELRIASYTVWISLAQIPGGCTLLATSSGFMNLMIAGQRELSGDARLAKFELLEKFHEHAKGFLSGDIVKKLEQELLLGPHGMKVKQWEVATE
jgi:hypothetical protein